MADNSPDIVQRAKTILYGHGIGQKPVLLQCKADASESVSGSIVTFDMIDNPEAAKAEAGDVLSVYDSATAAVAHALYVLSTSSATIACINGYLGSPVVADGLLDGKILELIPGGGVSEHIIFQHVETVFDTLLWPDLWEYQTYTITPDLSDYQVELNIAVESIEDAWQIIGDTRHEVAFDMAKNVPTGVSSTTVIAELYAFDSSDVYITTKNRIAKTSTFDEGLTQMVATGAAALSAGGTSYEATLEATGRDNVIRLERSVSRTLWQDFGTLRTARMDDLSREVDWFEYDRG
jgi:hypothetical protein